MCRAPGQLKGLLLTSPYTVANAALYQDSCAVIHKLTRVPATACCHMHCTLLKFLWCTESILPHFATHTDFFSCFYILCQWNLGREEELKAWGQYTFLKHTSDHLF
jgi:hypothetical protein